jgi:acetyl-CoA synthetase
MISALPGVTPLKAGSATLPFFGVKPVIVDSENKELEGVCEGNLCL